MCLRDDFRFFTPLCYVQNDRMSTLPNLQGLWLQENQLTGEIPSELGILSNLQRLYLSDNRLTGEIPSGLGNLDNLGHLRLSGNHLSGCVPAGLRDVPDNDFDALGLFFCDVLLSSLTVTPGELNPPFDPYQGDYDVVVSSPYALLLVTNEHEADITYLDRDGIERATNVGILEIAVELEAGVTVVGFRVVSQDRQSSHTYGIGVKRVPGPATIGAVTPGAGYMTVTWTPPDENGGADITSYDLRYIESSVADKSDANWTDVVGVWTSAADGGLEYALSGLTGDTQYDVQVRAVNRAGERGFWSGAAIGTPSIPSVCVAGGAVKDATNTRLISDCEALLVAGDTLAGTGSLNWSANVPMEEWKGVRLDGTPLFVQELLLDKSGLTGTIHPELGKLSNIKTLWLPHNQLTGEIPPTLGNLARLRLLDLSGNELSGEIPPELGRLSGLERLHLNHNGLAGAIPKELGNLQALERLNLRNNQLTGPITSELGILTNLRVLNLHSNRLTGTIPDLSDIAGLEELYLPNNDLTGSVPAWLNGMIKMRELWLWGNELSGAIPDLSPNPPMDGVRTAEGG